MLQYDTMNPQRTLILSNFFESAHFFLIIYIITPYLATFLPDSETGLVVSLGAIVTLSIFPFLPDLVRRYGTKRLAIFFSFVEVFVLAWLAVSPAPTPAFILIACAVATTPLINYQLDLLLEATIAKEGSTGRVRTLFLTAGNAAVVLSPLIAGLLLDSTDAYWRVFAVAASSLLPFILLMMVKDLPEGRPPRLVSVMEALPCLYRDKDLRAVVLSHGILQFFYHLAPLFIPLYLHHALHIPWSILGWMFTIMLVPFVTLEYPAGWLADRRWGDKEMLLAGFLIMGLGMSAIALITKDTMIILIAIILVVNRIGASLVEAMTEGHFFRRVSEADAVSVEIFRMTRPIAALIAPVVGSALLAMTGYRAMFFVTGILITIAGLSAARRLVDITPTPEAKTVDPVF